MDPDLDPLAIGVSRIPNTDTKLICNKFKNFSRVDKDRARDNDAFRKIIGNKIKYKSCLNPQMINSELVYLTLTLDSEQKSSKTCLIKQHLAVEPVGLYRIRIHNTGRPKVDEMLDTGNIQKLDKVKGDKANQERHELTRVSGIGNIRNRV